MPIKITCICGYSANFNDFILETRVESKNITINDKSEIRHFTITTYRCPKCGHTESKEIRCL